MDQRKIRIQPLPSRGLLYERKLEFNHCLGEDQYTKIKPELNYA